LHEILPLPAPLGVKDFGSGFTPSTALKVRPAKRLKLSKTPKVILEQLAEPSLETGAILDVALWKNSCRIAIRCL
jgi:hypothetical protein